MVPVTLKANVCVVMACPTEKSVFVLVPLCELEDILFCIEEFKRAASHLGCDRADKFENFGSIVSGHDCDNWAAAQADGTENDENDFTECLDQPLPF